ncbi:MAG TPA: tetratricopeptide repeat protein [Arachnia sp.]|nr:tetratricopeptide repeat protein [Arachnia sp.]HMT86187.1 tetratricopeptide repeat protein [Arachnia sp.]
MPEGFKDYELPAGVRAELKGVSKERAVEIGAHIWAAGQLIDVDPALAYRHAEAARRRAPRLPVTREATAETAYAAGEYAVALREYRAIRRMSGGDELIPVLADCERALGRPRDALEILNEIDPRSAKLELRIECLLVEAGIRDDLGQRAEAKRLLQAAISRKVGPPLSQARLRYAYADLLERDGDQAGARTWFERAGELDPGAMLDVADRLAALDGIVLPDFDEDEDEEDEFEVDEDGDVLPEEAPETDLTGDEHDDAEDESDEDESETDEEAPETGLLEGDDDLDHEDFDDEDVDHEDFDNDDIEAEVAELLEED